MENIFIKWFPYALSLLGVILLVLTLVARRSGNVKLMNTLGGLFFKRYKKRDTMDETVIRFLLVLAAAFIIFGIMFIKIIN